MSWFFPTVVILEVKNSYFLKSYLKAALNVTALGDLVRTGLTAVAPRSFLALFLFCFASLQKKFVLMCLHLEINFLKKRWSWWEFTHRLPYVEVEFDIWLFIILRFLYYFIIFFSVFFPFFFCITLAQENIYSFGRLVLRTVSHDGIFPFLLRYN